MTRGDWLVAIVVAAVAVAAWPLAALARPSEGIVITSPGGTTRVSEGAAETLRVAGRGGEVVVRVAGGAAWIERAECPDQICVHAGVVRDGTIVCAPNGVVVRVGGGGAYDARTR